MDQTLKDAVKQLLGVMAQAACRGMAITPELAEARNTLMAAVSDVSEEDDERKERLRRLRGMPGSYRREAAIEDIKVPPQQLHDMTEVVKEYLETFPEGNCVKAWIPHLEKMGFWISPGGPEGSDNIHHPNPHISGNADRDVVINFGNLVTLKNPTVGEVQRLLVAAKIPPTQDPLVTGVCHSCGYKMRLRPATCTVGARCFVCGKDSILWKEVTEPPERDTTTPPSTL